MKTVMNSLPVAVFKEGRKYIAYTPLLDLAAQGSSLKDVQKNFDEVLDIYMEETVKNGTLKQDLLKHGWKMLTSQQSWTPPRFSQIPPNHNQNMELKAFVMRSFPSPVAA